MQIFDRMFNKNKIALLTPLTRLTPFSRFTPVYLCQDLETIARHGGVFDVAVSPVNVRV